MAKGNFDEWVPEKALLKDTMGRYITQGLFLEINYDEKFAIYTLGDEDKEYNGTTYKSLKKLYLQTLDPTEYTFATTYLYNWDHWQKMLGNQNIARHVEEWREELEVKLRSQAVQSIIVGSLGNFNAAKWVADGSWEKKRGRPSKAELERERKIREKVADGLEEDSARIYEFARKGD